MFYYLYEPPAFKAIPFNLRVTCFLAYHFRFIYTTICLYGRYIRLCYYNSAAVVVARKNRLRFAVTHVAHVLLYCYGRYVMHVRSYEAVW